MKKIVVIKGAGDLASGIAHRLFRSGFNIVMTELPQPLAIRRTVAFAQAVFSGETVVEELVGVSCPASQAIEAAISGKIPVVVDQQGQFIKYSKPWAVVDATLAKNNVGTAITDAPIVIGVGPGFTAGQDVHAVVETMRGHYLGRVITNGQALPNTGVPGNIGGHTIERVLRSPCQGRFVPLREIGDQVQAGEVVAQVDGRGVVASISGVLRGLLYQGLLVREGLKIGDIDPRCKREHCFTISDKARAIGGGVLEALLMLNHQRSMEPCVEKK